MVEGFIYALEQGRLALLHELEARPLCIGPNLVAQGCDDLGDIPLAVFQWYADCQMDSPEGILMGCGLFPRADAEKIVDIGELGDR